MTTPVQRDVVVATTAAPEPTPTKGAPAQEYRPAQDGWGGKT